MRLLLGFEMPIDGVGEPIKCAKHGRYTVRFSF
jgi:hypothetical protein